MNVQIYPNLFSLKEAKDLVAGELFSRQISGHPAKAIALAANQSGSFAAVLEGPQMNGVTAPYLMHYRSDDLFVLSHGHRWILNLSAADLPGHQRDIMTSGIILRSTAKIVLNLNFADGSLKPHIEAIDLMSNTRTTFGWHLPDVLCIPRWCIWLSEDDRVREDAQPFFQFDAK